MTPIQETLRLVAYNEDLLFFDFAPISHTMISLNVSPIPSRVVQIDPITQPTRRIDPNPTNPTTTVGRRQVLTIRNRFWRVSFGFPPLKPEKPEPTKRFPDPGQNSRIR